MLAKLISQFCEIFAKISLTFCKHQNTSQFSRKFRKFFASVPARSAQVDTTGGAANGEKKTQRPVSFRACLSLSGHRVLWTLISSISKSKQQHGPFFCIGREAPGKRLRIFQIKDDLKNTFSLFFEKLEGTLSAHPRALPSFLCRTGELTFLESEYRYRFC